MNHTLSKAVRNNDIDTLASWNSVDFLKNFFDNIPEPLPRANYPIEFHSCNLIHIAAYYDSLECLEYLYNKGCPINSVTMYGFTPLFYACINGSFDSALFLCQHGANVNFIPKSSTTTPLLMATLSKSNDILHVLIEHGAIYPDQIQGVLISPKFLPLKVAIMTRNIEAICLFLEMNADPNHIKPHHNTPLISSIAMGLFEFVPKILSMTKKPSIVTDAGISALSIACESNKPDIVRLLLAFYVDPTPLLSKKKTIVHLAVSSGNPEILEMILETGISPMIADSNDIIPGFYMNNIDKPEAIQIYRLLIKYGWEVNHMCKSTTVLANYVIHPKATSSLLLFLLENGADPTLKCRNNMSVYQICDLMGTDIARTTFNSWKMKSNKI